jgi:hypothetical protein
MNTALNSQASSLHSFGSQSLLNIESKAKVVTHHPSPPVPVVKPSPLILFPLDRKTSTIQQEEKGKQNIMLSDRSPEGMGASWATGIHK